MSKRKIVAVIGGSSAKEFEYNLATALGKAIVDAGYRLATGGMGGIMEAASLGANTSSIYQEGDVIGILPGYSAEEANKYVDIAIATGMGMARNVILVQTADVVVAIGGGAGTLSEIALSWQARKPIVCLKVGGWESKLGALKLDHRRKDHILVTETIAETIAKIDQVLENHDSKFTGIGKPAISIERARLVVEKQYNANNLRFLGSGSEGYVWHNSVRTFKYFHSDPTPMRLFWLLKAFSQACAKNPSPHLFPFDIHFEEGNLIASYPYFEVHPYEGGQEDKVASYLQAMFNVGWVNNNYKAENMGFAPSGDLICFDLGASLTPMTELLFQQMCMRAFLTVHLPRHTRIKEFYSYTNKNDDFAILSEIGIDTNAFLSKFRYFYNRILSH